jgi:predicted site-specific integrase-resolvase
MENQLSDDPLVPSRPARLRFGVSSVTWWRWRNDGLVEPPVVINGRNYFTESGLARTKAKIEAGDVAGTRRVPPSPATSALEAAA